MKEKTKKTTMTMMMKVVMLVKLWMVMMEIDRAMIEDLSLFDNVELLVSY